MKLDTSILPKQNDESDNSHNIIFRYKIIPKFRGLNEKFS